MRPVCYGVRAVLNRVELKSGVLLMSDDATRRGAVAVGKNRGGEVVCRPHASHVEHRNLRSSPNVSIVLFKTLNVVFCYYQLLLLYCYNSVFCRSAV